MSLAMPVIADSTGAVTRPVGHAGRRFRIAVFCYGLPSPGQKRGGVDQAAHDLANALVDRGHDVVVHAYDNRPPDGRYAVRILPFRQMATSWIGKRAMLGYGGNLVALCVNYRGFDVVIAHGDSLLLPLTGKPVIRVMHGSALEEARSATAIGRRLLQSGVYLQELMTAWSQTTVGVSDNTCRSNRFVRRVIHNGVDLSVFKPDPRGRTEHPSLVFVGALDGRKRGAWLVEQFVTRIHPAFPDAELHMVTPAGTPTAGVVYHTGIERAALASLYQQAWVYVSPSTYEGFGLPYLEALACGTPVVATPNPGSREVLAEGAYGRLANDDSFAAITCQLLADAVQREALSREGLIRAHQFDIASAAAQYETLIASIVA
ncbi:MAG: glycosyltransferase family 4 protein [Vicinamibacterales bacterium]